MPVHDWSRVPTGTYHDFHCSWIIHLKETLNGGLLPEGCYALAEQQVVGPNAAFRAARRTLAIRHVSGHHLVALIEIASPANKDRPASMRDFVEKVHAALGHGCHVLLVDLFPPGRHDPRGLHGAVWEDFDPEEEPPPAGQPLTLASYVAATIPEVYVESLGLGAALPEMPLFLETDRYVHTPLEATYQAAYRGMPGFWRGVLEGREPPPTDS